MFHNKSILFLNSYDKNKTSVQFTINLLWLHSRFIYKQDVLLDKTISCYDKNKYLNVSLQTVNYCLILCANLGIS